MSRLYKDENTLVVQARAQAIDALEKLVRENRGWILHFTPTECFLGDEPVIRPQARGQREESGSAGEEQIPFIFFRDGIRAMKIPENVSREELEAWFDSLKGVGGTSALGEDLVTLLWQANLREILIDSVPLEQAIFVSSTKGDGPAHQADYLRYGHAPAGEEIRADLGQAIGAQALHLDTFDDWELADDTADVQKAYAEMLPEIEHSLEHFRIALAEECARDWKLEAISVFRQMARLDSSEGMRRAIAHALASWVAQSLQARALPETLRALELLREFDPELTLAEDDLIRMATELDNEALVEYLDQADPEEQGRFAAIAVTLGRPALDLAFAVLSKSVEARTKAAACTALTYLCADEPQLLSPYFADAHGDVMVQLVFTLGQIGGPEVLDLLRLAAQHPEPRVQKQVVMALGGVPAAIRLPPLLTSLESQDPGLIMASLQILTREKGHRVAEAILGRIKKPDFDSLTEDAQWALFNALTDVADETCVEGLEEMLFRGGFLARRCFSRSAAARTLQRIGSVRARAALKKGMRSLNSAIRNACNDVRDGA